MPTRSIEENGLQIGVANADEVWRLLNHRGEAQQLLFG
jgi:hypothetical protein